MGTESHLSEFLNFDVDFDRVSYMKRFDNSIADLIVLFPDYLLWTSYRTIFSGVLSDIDFDEPGLGLCSDSLLYFFMHRLWGV